MRPERDRQRKRPDEKGKTPAPGKKTICANRECRLRKAGCRGFEGCPGYLKKY
jgi:hypothetical protein